MATSMDSADCWAPIGR